MAFELRIEFSGLCLFVQKREGDVVREVGVVMPDARTTPNTETMRHSDGTIAVPHAGYLRFDLGDLLPGIPGAWTNSTTPRYEGVHRFVREELDLGLKAEPRVNTDELAFPNFGEIRPGVTIIEGLFDKAKAPPKQLLMRMRLSGGEFTTHSGGSNWLFPAIATSTGSPYQGQFANFAVWKRWVEQDDLALTITPFRDHKDNKPTTLNLRPRNQVLKLKVANLCAENPLEWEELKIRIITGEKDKDFKWLYRLLDTPANQFPVPVLDRTSGAAGAEQDCTGGTIDGHY
jgi:hypothetical protein